ncbi:DUF1361 domain-containing protein [Clostridium sp. DL1XJH146]
MQYKTNNDNKIIFMFSMLTIISSLLLAVRIFITGRTTYLFFIWNIFLCIVPLYLSMKINSMYLSGKKTNCLIALFIIWLLFYPNAPYIITDFVHLSFIDFFIKGVYVYSPIKEIRIWYDLVLFFSFIVTGFFMGLYSLYKVNEVLIDKFGEKKSFIVIFVITFLSSFAIYLGRFLRLNSWDVFTNPIGVIKSILLSIDGFALAFTTLFTVFLFLIYILFYFIKEVK